MTDIIEVKNKLGNGCTVPYVVWCDDGNTYVAKFPGNPQGTKAIVNEYIASRLCERLKLPIMNYSLIRVKMENYNDEMQQDIQPIEGTAFGTHYEENLMNILNPGQVAKSQNHNDAIKILIFDLLMGNYDRNKGNLMIDYKSKRLVMIDHTHLFGLGTIWDEYQLPRYIERPFAIDDLHPYNYSNIINSLKCDTIFYKELNKFIRDVKNIRREEIEEIMEKIPNDWNINSKEKELLIEYIINRFNRVDEIVELLNLKGGDNSEN